jgi:hypothetical protein
MSETTRVLTATERAILEPLLERAQRAQAAYQAAALMIAPELGERGNALHPGTWHITRESADE